MTNFIKTISDTMVSRMKNLLLMNFIIAWVCWNYEESITFLFVIKEAKDKILYIKELPNQPLDYFFIPLTISLLYIYILPLINLWIMKGQDKFVNQKIRTHNTNKKEAYYNDLKKVEAARLNLEHFLKDDLQNKKKNELKEIENEAKKIENELKEMENEAKKIENELKESENELKEIENELKEKENKLKEKENKLKENENELKENENELKEKENELKEKENELKEKEKELKIHLDPQIPEDVEKINPNKIGLASVNFIAHTAAAFEKINSNKLGLVSTDVKARSAAFDKINSNKLGLASTDFKAPSAAFEKNKD